MISFHVVQMIIFEIKFKFLNFLDALCFNVRVNKFLLCVLCGITLETQWHLIKSQNLSMCNGNDWKTADAFTLKSIGNLNCCKFRRNHEYVLYMRFILIAEDILKLNLSTPYVNQVNGPLNKTRVEIFYTSEPYWFFEYILCSS